MADYRLPQNRPSLESLQEEFMDQSESEKFRARTQKLIRDSGFDEHAFMLNCMAKLYERHGVSELTEFMSHVKSSLGMVDQSKSQSKAYEFVKGIPALSNRRIGYTFGRKGGLFFFLRNQGVEHEADVEH